jgi:hypothetical protein
MQHGSHARHQDDDRFETGDGQRLNSYGGLVTGFADTFAGALDVTRSDVIEAVDGPDPVGVFTVINGNRGTDNPARSTNRIKSEEHDREGVDRVFVAVTTDQFERLGKRLGAKVSV